jgi:hypothetical protein
LCPHLEDIELKVINNESLDAHEFGLGWNEQMLRIQQAQNGIQEKTLGELQYNGSTGSEINSAQVRGIINNLFNKDNIRANTQVYVNNIGETNNINLTVRRDRSRSIINALDYRRKYRLDG